MRLSRSTRLFSPWRPIRNGTGSIATRLRLPDGLVTASAGARPLALGGPAADIAPLLSGAISGSEHAALGRWPATALAGLPLSILSRAEPDNGNSTLPLRSETG